MRVALLCKMHGSKIPNATFNQPLDGKSNWLDGDLNLKLGLSMQGTEQANYKQLPKMGVVWYVGLSKDENVLPANVSDNSSKMPPSTDMNKRLMRWAWRVWASIWCGLCPDHIAGSPSQEMLVDILMSRFEPLGLQICSACPFQNAQLQMTLAT